jgi:hypothetical protein
MFQRAEIGGHARSQDRHMSGQTIVFQATPILQAVWQGVGRRAENDPLHKLREAGGQVIRVKRVPQMAT